MRTWTGALLAAAVGLAGLRAADDDPAALLAAQKKTAQASWDLVEAGPGAVHETPHLLIYAPQEMQRRLPAVGMLLERYEQLAREAVGFKPKEEVVPGKVTVYLFPSRETFTAFVRRVEGRRLSPGETGSYQAKNKMPHAAASPGRGKPPQPVETQAGEQLAGLVLSLKAGKGTPVPGWLTAGFGRATTYRAAPRDRAVLAERQQAARLARTKSAADVWGGGLSADEAGPLQASLADFLAYGPAAGRFPALLEGYKLEENRREKTTWQAVKAAGLEPERIGDLWKTWAQRAR